MTTNLNNPKDHPAPALLFGGGTTGTEIARCYGRITRRHGLGVGGDNPVSLLYFDHSTPLAEHVPRDIGGETEGTVLPPECCIAAKLPEPTVLEDLLAEGRLRAVPPELRLGQGVATEGLGTGNDPRVGMLLFEAHKEQFKARFIACLRRMQEYERQWRRIKGGDVEQQRGDLATVLVALSTVGGMGTGALRAWLRRIREWSEEIGIQVKVIVLALGLGTLGPPNAARAEENQSSIVKWLLAGSAGALANDPFSTDHPVPGRRLFDSLIVLTNLNSHGEVGSLTALKEMAAQFIYLLTRTPVGAFLRESVINIENGWELDRYGVPACISTVGLSVIHADRPKALAFCSARMAEEFFSGLSSGGAPQEVQSTTLGLVRSLGLVESEDEALAAEKISRLQCFGGQNAGERARALFRRGAEELRGYRRCLFVARRYAHVMNVQIPTNITARVKEEARGFVSEVSKALQQLERQFLRASNGPRDLLSTLRIMFELISRFASTNDEKLNALNRLSRPVLERIDNNRRVVEELRRQNALIRWLRWFTAKQIARELEVDGEDAISMTVEIEVRQILANEVFPQLLDIVSDRTSRASALLSQVNSLAADCTREAERVLQSSPLDTAPVGVQLFDRELLVEVWMELVERNGGLEELRSRMLESFLGHYGSLAAFADRPKDELNQVALDEAGACFIDAIQQLDVETVFHRVCPTRRQKRTFVHQCVKESQGRLRIRGHTGSGDKWVKILGVPEASRAHWLHDLATSVDPSPGEWNLVTMPGNEEALYFIQYRAGLSPRAVFAGQRGRRTSRSVRDIAASGVDPVTAFLPDMKPSAEDAQVALAKAWSIGALGISDGQGVCIDTGNDREYLGTSLDEAATQLRRSYATLAKVGYLFAWRLAQDPDAVIAKVADLQRGGTGGGTEGLLAVVTQETVRRVLAEARELQRYFAVPDELETQ